MPTVAELVHWRGPLALDVCAGAAGLGREISRLVRFSVARLDIQTHTGDLVLLSLEDWKFVTDGSIGEAFGERQVAAVVVSASGDEVSGWISGVSSTPVLLLSEPRLDRAGVALKTWLSECRVREEREAAEILEELDGVVPSETEPVAARLSQLTGKCVLLHDAHGTVEGVCQPAHRSLKGKGRELESGIRAATEAVRRRLCDGRQQAIGPTYDELPVADLAMLSVATFNPGCEVQHVSLLAHPSEFGHRDSAALAATFATLRQDHTDQPNATPAQSTEAAEAPDHALLGWLLRGRLHQAGAEARRHGVDLSAACIGLAVRDATDTPASTRRARLSAVFGESAPLLRVEDDVIVGLLPCVGKLADRALRHGEVLRWQAAMRASAGPPSIGYTAVHTGVAGARRALIEAKEALTLGESVLGAGHASSFAQLRIRQLVSRVDEDPTLRELRARLLGPLLVHDQSHKNDLLSTLQIYLDTGCRTVQTADLLGVHRNSVLYRLQRIVELSHVDLEDAETRLLLQLALQSATLRPEVRSDEALRVRDTDLVWSRPDPFDAAPVWMSDLAVNGVHVES